MRRRIAGGAPLRLLLCRIPYDRSADGLSDPRVNVARMSRVPVALGAVNVTAADPQALAEFWGGVTGATPHASAGWVYLPAVGPGGFAVIFQLRTEASSGDQPVHVDLTVPWGMRQPEVDRLLACGATFRWDVLEEYAHVQWRTLADPEGNMFCVAERPPASGQSSVPIIRLEAAVSAPPQACFERFRFAHRPGRPVRRSPGADRLPDQTATAAQSVVGRRTFAPVAGIAVRGRTRWGP